MTEIYALRDPNTGDIRYIGKANDSAARLRSHIRDSTRRRTPVYAWIRKLATQGQTPRVEVLERTDDWQTAERRLIAQFRESGARLLNVADGGDEPACAPEVRARNGKTVASAIHSDPARRRLWELKRALGAALRDGFVSQPTKEKMVRAARMRPDLFGEWATLIESGNGCPAA